MLLFVKENTVKNANKNIRTFVCVQSQSSCFYKKEVCSKCYKNMSIKKHSPSPEINPSKCNEIYSFFFYPVIRCEIALCVYELEKLWFSIRFVRFCVMNTYPWEKMLCGIRERLFMRNMESTSDLYFSHGHSVSSLFARYRMHYQS